MTPRDTSEPVGHRRQDDGADDHRAVIGHHSVTFSMEDQPNHHSECAIAWSMEKNTPAWFHVRTGSAAV